MTAQRIPKGWANRRLLRRAMVRQRRRDMFGECGSRFMAEHPEIARAIVASLFPSTMAAAMAHELEQERERIRLGLPATDGEPLTVESLIRAFEKLDPTPADQSTYGAFLLTEDTIARGMRLLRGDT